MPKTPLTLEHLAAAAVVEEFAPAPITSLDPDDWTISALELCRIEYPPVRYTVPGYVAEGCTILAGKPKVGKSWLVLDMAIAVATRGSVLGSEPCSPGRVLYLALEDNPRRIQDRLNKIHVDEEGNPLPMPENLHLATECPRAHEGGLEKIRAWLERYPDAKLLIIDVLAKFRSQPKGRSPQIYDNDFSAISDLQSLAMEFGVSIVVVHHVRKSNGETSDPIEKVSGTLGLSGAADTIIVLDSSSQGYSLCGRGRDIQEFETDVKFDTSRFRWVANGPVAEVRVSDTRKAIVEFLAFMPEPASPKEIAAGTGLSDNVVRQQLGKLVEAGEVQKTGRAQYILPGNKWYTPDSGETPVAPEAGGHNKHNNRNNEEQ